MVLINWLVEAGAAKRDPDGSNGVIPLERKSAKGQPLRFFFSGGQNPTAAVGVPLGDLGFLQPGAHVVVA